ncbi:hypothetical protein AMTRI_Chr09g12570 [Amborella trichopoda]
MKNHEEKSSTIQREFDSSDDEIDFSVKPEFYDSDIDEKDTLWVEKTRKGRVSDAVLSCPACFTTLCLDCQRHERYLTQYRAMFVRNCTIKTNQILHSPSVSKRKQAKAKEKIKDSKNSGEPSENGEEDEIFRPVCCSICKTEVAVMDKDEVYHFFNILASNP